MKNQGFSSDQVVVGWGMGSVGIGSLEFEESVEEEESLEWSVLEMEENWTEATEELWGAEEHWAAEEYWVVEEFWE
jgi:hypothetical protein